MSVGKIDEMRIDHLINNENSIGDQPYVEMPRVVYPLPWSGAVGFEPHEEKVFTFCSGTITIINDREEPLKLEPYVDEGVPSCKIVGSNRTTYHWLPLPCNGKNVIVRIDYSWH